MSAPALLSLLRGYPDTPEALRARLEALPADALVEQARQDGLSALLLRLVDDCKAEFPRERLLRDAQQLTAGAMRVKRLALKALGALEAAQVKAVLLKGVGLASRYYPDPLVRGTSDVDLLVSPQDVEPALAALVPLGLRAPEGEDKARQLARTHHLALYGDAGMVELHFQALNDFGAVIDAGPLMAEAVPAQLEGRRVHYLKPEHELVQLAAHAAHHAIQRLAHVLDLKLLLRAHPELDFAQVVALAQAARMPSAVFLSLLAAASLGARVPESALRALAPGGVRERFLRELVQDERLAARVAERKWRSYGVLVALHESNRARLDWFLEASRVWLDVRLRRLWAR